MIERMHEWREKHCIPRRKPGSRGLTALSVLALAILLGYLFFTGKVIQVLDGDTVRVFAPGRE